MFFFFQAEDGIRDAQESRGLGDVYKRQEQNIKKNGLKLEVKSILSLKMAGFSDKRLSVLSLSLIHI